MDGSFKEHIFRDWRVCSETGARQHAMTAVTKRTASRDGGDRRVSAHFASVRVTYEIPTVAQRRNIVGKCQGSDARPVGIKRAVNTHEAQSAPAETYGSHLSRSTARQIFFFCFFCLLFFFFPP